jgi:hypothetical protein
MNGSNIKDLYIQLVESNGDKYVHGSVDCTIFLTEHKNCKGCPAEIGCAKVARLMINALSQSMYKPNTYDDFVKMQTRTDELSKMILCAKTLEELKSIPQY